MTADETVLSLTAGQRGDVMRTPDEVSAMLRLKALEVGFEADCGGTSMTASAPGGLAAKIKVSGSAGHFADIISAFYSASLCYQ